MDYNLSKAPSFSLLDEPALTFNSEDTYLDENPLRGLLRFGAYNGKTFEGYTPKLRVATIAPASGWPKLRGLVDTIRSGHEASDRRNYVPSFPGFENLFRVPLVAGPKDVHIKWPDDLMALARTGAPHERLFSAMSEAMARLDALHDQFDVVLVHLPDAWAAAFTTNGFDAHDALKALGARYAIPTQVINDHVFTFRLKASLAWRLAIALFTKAGGIPWKLAPMAGVPEDTAYIGLAYALRGDPKSAQFVTCCSQVFDADGGGMQFVAFEAKEQVTDPREARRNPFLSRSDMRAVMARSLSLYLGRNGGRLPRRLVVHKTTSFKDEELQGVFDGLSTVPEVECVEIGSSATWRGVWLKQGKKGGPRSVPDRAPVPRGTVLTRTDRSALLWASGNAPSAALSGALFFQGSKSIPRPLNIIRHTGSGPLEVAALETLALTKMDWNNDALYDPVPVTIRYSQKLARTIANVPDLPGHAYPYRLFM
ncbi:argonaute/piwi family protein [Paraburkholderia fungorum]|uniref:argonaute/piwi family protein n=1 Tax=Paraburkholderia fungorum TaxID=134537 RepID=UPI0004AB1EDE|nr:nuclease PIN [Paraburkholderia fungorum]KFX61994.1 nuclease PIN [Burkholderia sp. K24]USX10306.1 nuclease PIN [Paraburkholderia fungorum]